MERYEKEIRFQRKTAIIAGTAILIMAVCAGLAVGLVNNSLIINGDADATRNHIIKALPLFRFGIFNWLMILLCDIVAAWALYIFLSQVDKSLSFLGAVFRLSYCSILAIAIMNLINVLILCQDNALIMLQTDLKSAQVMLYLNAFNKMWSFGLIIFGIHLLIIGYLVFKSGFVPKIIGVLLLLASVSYIMIHFLRTFLPQFENTTTLLENILSLPMAIGELTLGIWLIIKGGRIPAAGR